MSQEETNLEEIKNEVVKEGKKQVIKSAIKELVAKLISSAVIGLISACSKLAEKIKVKQEGETRWYMILLYTVLVAALSAGAVLGTQYSAELTEWLTSLFSFLN